MKEYRILQGDDPAALVAVVNVQLAHGWSLVGGVFVHTETYVDARTGAVEHTDVWAQAMVGDDQQR